MSRAPQRWNDAMLSLLSIAALVLAGASAPASAQSRVPLTIATVPSVPSASTHLALDKGYFRDAGLDVTVERIDSLSKALAFVATNRIQVAQGGISAGYFNAVAQGLPIVMALEGGSTPLYHLILVHPELAGKIKVPADLKGRRVALSAPGSNAVYELGMMLASAGLRIKDVDVKYIAFPQMAVALANRAVDAALMVAPFTEVAVERKIGVPWIDPEPFVKPLPMTNLAYIASVDWIGQNRDVARRLFVALARAGRDYCQAYHRGPNRAEVIDSLIANKIVSDRDMLDKMQWQARNPNGTFSVASLLSMQAFFKQEGIIDREVAAERLADTSFAEDAARELGPFELINKASKLAGCR
jgi:NitT/TauT family transport system substrate-binding protein